MTGPQGDSERADQARDFLGEPFRLHTIVEVPAPEGSEGVWQQYVIVQGINTINGLRPGTRSEVPRIGRPPNRGSKPLPLQSEFQEKVEIQ
jgi:hypothetical protein